MNSVWQSYLHDQHAVIENDRVLHFGDIAVELKDTQNKVIMTDLSHRGLIKFSGDDAKNFLQSQLSCDIREINSEMAQYGGYCTFKGRILASFFLWQKHQDVFMQLPANLVASTIKRLSLYVLRSKVQLTDISNALIRIGISGPNVSVLAAELCRSENNTDHAIHAAHIEKTSILHVAHNRIELITPVENAPAVWERFNQYAKPVGTSCWDWLDIQSGIPVIQPETQEAFLPQMINLDAIGGVSFKKGCYPGQEIVARTQYLGKLKRRMFLVHIITTEMIKVGDALYSADMADQSCGNIVNIAPSPYGGYDALAVIQQSSVNTCNIHWQSLQGPKLEIKSLPYTLPA
ncbi:CAF17-like 4Fe-4S cluster assembly/insertion protein YgfZ [Nitrosomonas supralitoralis]|uniref:Folate-binding protein n=1 Tax=Nitrosomonas supralitoralis TaxID=2116706 RepID=A0A2P7NT90_9PROT|nr:folate-binding protein YgfZ [Nitrosomonas supralitoralis]PSJ16692.1 folate-binding protein [Nitrosomonas supralitoralis]